MEKKTNIKFQVTSKSMKTLVDAFLEITNGGSE